MSTPKPLDPTPERTASSQSIPSQADRPTPGAPAPGLPGAVPSPANEGTQPDVDFEAVMAQESSFAEMLSEFEQQHRACGAAGEPVEGLVIEVAASGVFVDLGMKREGLLPLDAVTDRGGRTTVKAGDPITVAVVGQSGDGYYQLSLVRAERPKDWTALEQALSEGRVIAGTVSGVIRGGLSVDVGARAFLPASRSGARDAAEMEALVGQEIRCKVIQLDTAKDDVVVDRRVVLEEEARAARQQRFATITEGAVLRGTVRTLTDFGAFVDLGGIDGLLHVADMAWHRVRKPSDLLTEGDCIEVQVLKVDPEKQKISLGRKQLVPDPWSLADQKYVPGQRVTGTVVRLTDFGAFVELEPGVDGMIHVSEMSWGRKIRKPADLLKNGETVEAVVLSVSGAKRRIALGLKQALGDPWADVDKRFPVGTAVEGTVANLAKFGAFVQLVEGLEGMVHIADITNEKRLNHPNEVLSEGQKVRALVLEIDRERKRIRLGMKQLEPTSTDEYIAEHKVGDLVTGRVVESARKSAKVDLGEGVVGICRAVERNREESPERGDRPDLSTMTARLAEKWRAGNLPAEDRESGALRAGEVRRFRIVSLDAEQKRVEVEPAG